MSAARLSNIDGAAAAGRPWDVLVVGAGPAGASAALGLARAGFEVLLVDRATFPRPKVCGGCLSAPAVSLLRDLGVGTLPGAPLRELRLGAGAHSASLPITGGAPVPRETLDAAIVGAAVASGAHFLDGTTAVDTSIGGARRRVTIRMRSGEERRLESRLVLAADGVAASFAPELGSRRARSSRIGLGASLPASPGPPAGVISMTVSSAGYVGAVRFEDGTVNLAAALDPEAVRVAGPGGAVAAVLRSAGHPLAEAAAQVRWRGTAPLTHRRRRLVAERLLALGDSAGYVEPFTGEGIAWALRCGMMGAELGARVLAGRADASTWENWWRSEIRPAHRRCAVVARSLRAGPLTTMGIAALGALPRAAGALAGLFGTGPAPAHP